jgi:hypothetical protein
MGLPGAHIGGAWGAKPLIRDFEQFRVYLDVEIQNNQYKSGSFHEYVQVYMSDFV